LLLMLGLAQSTASGAALLLNLEGVLTALLAWFVLRENFDRRILIGMLLITAGGVLLVFEPGQSLSLTRASLLILAACACWAIDNNLTRKIAASDALQIATIKGLTAALVNLALAWYLGALLPAPSIIAMAGVIGFAGYGLSLVLFVVALRELGSARTGAYFSAAPMVGAALSLVLLQETPGLLFWIAALLMGAGLLLHWHEHHQHEHHHEPLTHAHPHSHNMHDTEDMHHQHTHVSDGEKIDSVGEIAHSHGHEHTALPHSHPHFPDIHHRHQH
jgi:drug/metabolite transporter (DMT)-like permease